MKYLLLLSFLFIVGCGDNAKLETVSQPQPCTVKNTDSGATILCPDGTEVVVNDGQDGNDGSDGQNGKDGSDGSDGKDGTNGIDGVAGQDGQDGTDGQDGADGQDGEDGADAVLLSTQIIPKHSCTQVASGIWVENINSGLIFDVYYNASCSDAQGEHCDNVATSYDSSGSIVAGQGSSTVCWVDNVQFSGVQQSNGDIKLYILDFN